MQPPVDVTAPPIDRENDHYRGNPDAKFSLIEYGSYACIHCRNAQAVVEGVRERLGDDLVYVFRHKPLERDPYARTTAKLAEALDRDGRFFEAHEVLMSRRIATDEHLADVAETLGVDPSSLDSMLDDEELEARIDASNEDAKNAGIGTTPTFYINGQYYAGPWDEMSLLEALDPPIARRADRSMRAFAGWAPGTGLLLAACAIVALVLANSPLAPAYSAFWESKLSLAAGGADFGMSARHWVNDGLMAIFFLVVGLEIKREMSIGTLSNPRDAILPGAAALGGMLLPALLFTALTWNTTRLAGWGIPMATDIAFSLGLLALLGRRVPLRLKVFLTALAIVDDLGAILVIALFYGHGFDLAYAALAAACVAGLVVLNWSGVYSALPYATLGVLLWLAVYASGVHATLAGILLAMTVPTRPPPNLKGLLTQVRAIIEPEVERLNDAAKDYPGRRVVRALDEVHDRIESPAHRIERNLEPWSSLVILPLFALANAGVTLGGGSLDWPLVAAIGAGLVLGKPLGVAGAAWLVTRLGWANWPESVNPGSLVGAGALAGVGFTMSLFIANESFADAALTDSARFGVLLASSAAATAGLAILHRSLPRVEDRS